MAEIKNAEIYKAYLAGYRDGVADAYSGKAQTHTSGNPSDMPVAVMGLSTHARNCLIRAGCSTLADVLALNDDAVGRMRGLGPKTASEIAHWLADHYYFSSVWVQYV